MAQDIANGRDAPWRNEEELAGAIESGLTNKEIANRWDCHRKTIANWVKKHELTEGRRAANPKLKDEDYLRREYVEKERTVSEIGENLGCGDSTVSRWLNRHGVKTRDGEYKPVLSESDKNEVVRLYEEEYLSMEKIADRFGCSTGPIFDTLSERDIDTGKSRYSGHRNDLFNGGKYLRDGLRLLMGNESWYKTKRRVREDAGRECEMCGGDNGDKRLDVHHIIPIVSGGCNDDELLMALCRGCHSKADSVARDISTPMIEYA